jgi:leader peptidase (prepilin peptidase)/N-methyltransferase
LTTCHHAILALLFAIVGSCVGSFVNVCAYRLPRSVSLIRPPSRCPRCRCAIRLRDNVPLGGWLLLRGRCRDCRGAIPPRYAVVEMMLGVLFASVYLAAIALAPGDLWEQVGAHGVLTGLLGAWTLIATGTSIALVRHDAHARVREPGAEAWRLRAEEGVDLV